MRAQRATRSRRKSRSPEESSGACGLARLGSAALEPLDDSAGAGICRFAHGPSPLIDSDLDALAELQGRRLEQTRP